MWMNLDMVPAGQSMYTVALTQAPVETPESERWIEEIDVVASSSATVSEVITAASEQLIDYDGCRIVGVANQSDGYVVVENWYGIE